AGAKHRALSGGGEHGGRVLECVDERLEQQNDEKMNQNVRSGGSFVETWRSFEADLALETFAAEFDAPSQTVEVEDILRREVVVREGGQQNDPVGRLKGLFGNPITFPLRIPSGLAPCFCGGLFRLADGDQAQCEVGTALAFDEDRPIDAATFGRPQHGEEINRLAIFVAPARPFPFAAHQHVSASLKHAGNTVGLQIGPVGNADFAFDDRDAIKRLPFLFVCQLKVTEALARQIEGAVNAPQGAFPLGRLSSLGNAGSIDDADQAAPAGLRGRRTQQLVNQQTQPVAALSQAIEQRRRRYIHQSHRRGPGRRQPETAIAKTIGKQQPQQVYCALYPASLQKGAAFPCAAFKKRRATKLFYEKFPVPIQKRFVSHPTLNHKSIPTSKNILTPMRCRGDERQMDLTLFAARLHMRQHGGLAVDLVVVIAAVGENFLHAVEIAGGKLRDLAPRRLERQRVADAIAEMADKPNIEIGEIVLLDDEIVLGGEEGRTVQAGRLQERSGF